MQSRVRTSIKAVWERYVVTIENGIITSRNLKILSLATKLNEYKNIDCKVFNGNVLIFDKKEIIFYSVPNLKKLDYFS